MRIEDLRAGKVVEPEEEAEEVEDVDGQLEEDLNEALELLDTFNNYITTILKSRKKRISVMQEVELKELVLETETFLDQWNFSSADAATNLDLSKLDR